jgi:hypothetical protein
MKKERRRAVRRRLRMEGLGGHEKEGTRLLDAMRVGISA